MERRDSAPPVADLEADGGLSRGAFLLRGALATGAAYGAASVGPFVSRALALGGDLAILDFALTLEHLETSFYARGGKLGLGGDAKQVAQQFGDQEAAHVKTLEGAIKAGGSRPSKAPKFKFPMHDEQSFLRLAHTIEGLGVSAYNGLIPRLRSKELVAAAASIAQVEGRHTAVLALLTQKAPAPVAFDKPLGKGEGPDRIKRFLA